MKTRLLSLLALILLLFASWWVFARMFGFAPPFQLGAVIVGTLFALVLVWSARRIGAGLWISAGLLLLAGIIFLPSYSISEVFANLAWPRWLFGLRDFLNNFWPIVLPSLAILMAALLLSKGLRFLRMGRQAGEEGQDFQTRRRYTAPAVVCLALSVLLLVRMLHNLYWVMVWDTTDDSIGIIWLFFLILPVLFSGYVLAVTLPRGNRWGSLVLLLIMPALVAGVYTLGHHVDFRQLTEDRGGRVSRALEAYYTREDRYPENLGQLTPRYLLSLPGPVIIFGQDWCYDGGEDYYRLGYIDREHWSSPILTGQVVSSRGAIPDLPPICDEEITVLLKKRYPDVYK